MPGSIRSGIVVARGHDVGVRTRAPRVILGHRAVVRSPVVQPKTPTEMITPEHEVEIVSEPVRARAWWGETLLADSTSAVRSEEPGVLPTLWFPVGDVRTELLVDEGHRMACPAKGDGQLWSLEGTPDATASAAMVEWAGMAERRDDGVDAAWSFDEPSPGAAGLKGLVGFDHDRVRVELVEDWDPDERGTVVTRFPNWGDVAHLVDILDVRPDGEMTWTTAFRGDVWRPVVEGSQMLAQSLVAATRHSGGRRVVSAHMVFARAADSRAPLQLHLDEVTNGRTFTAVDARVSQGGRVCASGTVMLDAGAPDLMRHEQAAPPTAGPYDSPAYDMSVTGRALRVVDGAYSDDPDQTAGPPEIDAWVRFREVPDDPALHTGLLAQFCGHMSIAAAMRPHEGISQSQAHRSISTAISAIAVSLHADVRADEWMHYRHVSTYAGAGMTRSECHVHDIDGHLLASFSVDAMVRAMPPRDGAADHRTAM
jgi:acyl-CoA thioesterase-2